MAAETPRRVERNTAEEINRARRAEIQESIRYHAARPREIPARLAELDREWDLNRAITASAGAVLLAGLALTALVDRRVPAAARDPGTVPAGDAAAPHRISHAGRNLRGTKRPQDAGGRISHVWRS